MTRASDNGSSADWMRFWEQAQRQAWDAWSELARQSAPPARSPHDALWDLWADGLERLWQGRSAQLSGTSQEVFSRLIDQGKGFLFLSHQLLRVVEKIQAQGERGGDWKKPLREAIDQVQDQLRQWSGVSAGQTALWGLPFEMWERLAAALSFTPGDWARHMKDMAGNVSESGQDGRSWMDQWPALGVTREWQLSAKEGSRLSERYQEAWRCYSTKLLDVGILALDYLYERLIEAGETGQQIRQLRTVYDLWVDSAEQAYAEVVSTPEFAQQQAELINAAVALKLHVQDSLERAALANNLPTRTELDSAHRAIKDLRTELDRLRSQTAEPATPAPGARRNRKVKKP